MVVFIIYNLGQTLTILSNITFVKFNYTLNMHIIKAYASFTAHYSQEFLYIKNEFND